jgi:hypothetical protein
LPLDAHPLLVVPSAFARPPSVLLVVSVLLLLFRFRFVDAPCSDAAFTIAVGTITLDAGVVVVVVVCGLFTVAVGFAAVAAPNKSRVRALPLQRVGAGGQR